MFSWKIRIIKSDDVVISKTEYHELRKSAESLKRVYQKLARASAKRKKNDS